MSRRDPSRPAPVAPRLRLAQALAFVAVVAALLGALGPAERDRTTYSWPPPELPEGQPSRVWYTPLLLARRFPDSISASLPCSPQPALADAELPVTVLATARSPELAGGLAVRHEGNRLVVGVGGTSLGYLPLSDRGADTAGCTYRLTIGEEGWSISGGPRHLELSGDDVGVPVVNGLFSALDLRAGEPAAVEITTEVHGADPITRQALAWGVAALCLIAAVLLAVFERRPRRPVGLRTLVGRALAHAHPVDAAIAAVLLVWWVLSPVFWDDGWTLARHDAFLTTGGFSNYYDAFGSPLPLGYWLEWLQHWITQSTTAILLLRLPAVVCLATTWLLVRWILRRLLAPTAGTGSVVLWALASSFAVGAMAWGMTLRLEPVLAVLVTGVMACTVRFLERPSAAPVAGISLLVPLAITGHPVGVVSLAPVILVLPTMIRWARSQPALSTTFVTSAIALLLVLGFLGSDVTQRSADAQILGDASTTVVTWRDELIRYDVFSAVRSSSGLDGYGTPLRRASVALMGLAVLAWAIRLRRPSGSSLDRLPASILAISLVLLIATPSKWPWHFGALTGLLALAVAAETANLDGDRERWQRIAAVPVAALAIAWAWSPQHAWNVADLRTFEWTQPFEVFPVVAAAIALPVLLLAGVLIGRGRGRHAGWRVVPWTAPVLLLPMIAFTGAVLVVDAAATSSWTLTRQTLAGAGGAAGCGLADDLLVPNTNSLRSLQLVDTGDAQAEATPGWVPVAPAPGLALFGLGPKGGRSAQSPWFELPSDGRLGMYLAGTPDSLNSVALEWGRARGGRTEGFELRPIELLPVAEAGSTVAWRFAASGDLPTPPEGSDAIRLVLRSEVPPRDWLAYAPVAYSDEPLARRLEGNDMRSLIMPNLRMYFPCAEHARLSRGLAEEASIIVTTSDANSPLRYVTSPFAGLLDLYQLEPVSIADSENAPEELVVFSVDTEIAGGRLAPLIERPS